MYFQLLKSVLSVLFIFLISSSILTSVGYQQSLANNQFDYRKSKFVQTAQTSVQQSDGCSSEMPPGTFGILCIPSVEETLIPIIFIPGIGGTKMKQIKDGKTMEVWPSVGYSSSPSSKLPPLTGMELQKDGVTQVNPFKYDKELLQSVAIPVIDKFVEIPVIDVYGGFLNYLKVELGYTEGKDLYTFPYDFRLDNSNHFADLDNLIKTVLKNTNSDKVVLIAHSMGGLLSRSYILSSSERTDKVKALITIGTPYLGSVKGYYALIDGYDFGNPYADKNTVKAVAQNAPGPYELLPRAPFMMDGINGKFVSVPDSFTKLKYKSLTHDKLNTQNEWSMNGVVLNIADNFFSSLKITLPSDAFPVDNYVISGTGICTLNGYIIMDYDQSLVPKEVLYNKFNNGFYEREIKVPYAAKGVEFDGRKVILIPVFGDGDGTVPLWSQQVNSASGKTWLLHNLRLGQGSTEHGALPANYRVQDIIGWIIDYLNGHGSVPEVLPIYDPAKYTPMKPIPAFPFGPSKFPKECYK